MFLKLDIKGASLAKTPCYVKGLVEHFDTVLALAKKGERTIDVDQAVEMGFGERVTETLSNGEQDVVLTKKEQKGAN